MCRKRARIPKISLSMATRSKKSGSQVIENKSEDSNLNHALEFLEKRACSRSSRAAPVFSQVREQVSWLSDGSLYEFLRAESKLASDERLRRPREKAFGSHRRRS